MADLTEDQQNILGDALIEQATNIVSAVEHFIQAHVEPAYDAFEAATSREDKQNTAAILAVEFGIALQELTLRAGAIGNALEAELEAAGLDPVTPAPQPRVPGFVLPEGRA